MRFVFVFLLAAIPFVILTLATGHFEVGGMWPYFLGVICLGGVYLISQSS